LNVIAPLKGEKNLRKVVLVAHHDNAFGLGACDNARLLPSIWKLAFFTQFLPQRGPLNSFRAPLKNMASRLRGLCGKYVKPNASQYKAARDGYCQMGITFITSPSRSAWVN
jgi:hypothetical protein